jgi:hypothetical protein
MSSYVPPHLRKKSPAPASAPASAPAPPLRQGTMASLSRAKGPSPVPVPTDTKEEFPGLKGQNAQDQEKKSAWGQVAGKRFADLARSWGVQQKEEEEERKRLARERITAEQKEREREEKERAYFRIVDPTKVLYGGEVRPQMVYDLGGDQDDLVAEVEEEESDLDEEVEDVVYRRSKHDLY